MDPFFDRLKEERDQEAQIKHAEEKGRRITGAEDPSSLVQRNISNLVFPKEKTSIKENFTDQTMNVSASHESAVPLITLEQCQKAVSEHPNARNLIIQRDPSGTSSAVTPATFYDHFVSAISAGLMSGEKNSDQEIAQKSRQMTRELLGLLQQQYGEKIADASFPSAPHRIAIAHPLSSKNLDAILTTTEVLKSKEDDFVALESDPQIQALTQQVQAAEARVNETTKATHKKLSALEKRNISTVRGSSALQLAALEKAEHAAHQESIAVKDRLAIALRTTFQKDEDPDLSSDAYPSETTGLLSRNINGKTYQSISQNPE
ncbi:MAG: hypothetical protein K2W97_05055 [Chthoniobacterales bacterium]|nr:hypothetical protein [Chthoniobacterales bacterium]